MFSALLLSLCAAPQPPDVADVFESRCVQCHRDDGVAPFSVETHQQARPWAKSIARAVATKQMPPFGAAGPIDKYVEDLRLTDAEIDAVLKWADAPRPYEPVEYVEPARFSSHDVLRAQFPRFEVKGDSQDSWWIVSATEPLAEDVDVVGYRWGDHSLFHHAELMIVDSASAPAEPVALKHMPAGRLLPLSVYVPGFRPARLPEGYAISLKAGQQLVARAHIGGLEYDTLAEPWSVELLLASDDTRELPDQHIMMWSRGQIGVIPPGATQTVSGTWVPFEDIYIWSVFPHMHEIGQRATVTVNGEELIDVPRYSFDSQQNYILAEPAFVNAGDIVIGKLEWMNNTDKPIEGGPRSDQEMGIIVLTWTPAADNHAR